MHDNELYFTSCIYAFLYAHINHPLYNIIHEKFLSKFIFAHSFYDTHVHKYTQWIYEIFMKHLFL